MQYPALAAIAGFGLLQVVTMFSKYKKFIKIFIASFFLITLFSVSYYFHQYFVQQIVHQPVNRQEGYEKLVASVNTKLPLYRKVVIAGTVGSPAIHFLFFTKYDPASFQKQISKLTVKTVQQMDRVKFDKYTFYNEDCFNKHEKDILYVERGNCSFPSDVNGNGENILRSDGSIVFKVFGSEQK